MTVYVLYWTNTKFVHGSCKWVSRGVNFLQQWTPRSFSVLMEAHMGLLESRNWKTLQVIRHWTRCMTVTNTVPLCLQIWCWLTCCRTAEICAVTPFLTLSITKAWHSPQAQGSKQFSVRWKRADLLHKVSLRFRCFPEDHVKQAWPRPKYEHLSQIHMISVILCPETQKFKGSRWRVQL